MNQFDVIDHTVSLGEAKCLVILGIPLSTLAEHGDSPAHHAMTGLTVGVMTRSNGPAVAAVLAQTSTRTGVPVQIVADHGSDLSAGIARFQTPDACPGPARSRTRSASGRECAERLRSR